MKKIIICIIVSLSLVGCNSENDQKNIDQNNIKEEKKDLFKRIKGNSSDRFFSISSTNDGGYMAVGNSSSSNSVDIPTTNNGGACDGLIAKYDSENKLEFTLLVGGDDLDLFHDAAELTDGSYIVVGTTSSSQSGDISDELMSEHDAGLIAKIDREGNLEYTRTFPGEEDNRLFDVEASADGGFVTVGFKYPQALFAKYNKNGDLEYSRVISEGESDAFYGLTKVSDGSYIAVGRTLDLEKESSSGLVVKISSSGDIEYRKILNETKSDSLKDVVATTDGGFVAVGSSADSNDNDISFRESERDNGLIAKYDKEGNLEYTRNIGGDDADYFDGVVVTSDGGYIASGTSLSSMNGDIEDEKQGSTDGLLAIFDAQGNLTNTVLIGANSAEDFNGIIKNGKGQYVSAGHDYHNDAIISIHDFSLTTIIDARDFSVEFDSDLSDGQIIEKSFAKATDPMGIDITERIIISNKSDLDLSKSGTYTVELSVVDRFSRGSVVEINITVESNPMNKYIYTFLALCVAGILGLKIYKNKASKKRVSTN